MEVPRAVGRFAPSPTGPLHLGSLVAAVGSFLFARSAGGRWLVRLEDLDTPRSVPGAADEILRALERHGLFWDGSVESQSLRVARYEEALLGLRARGLVFDCACTRAEILRSASAPLAPDPVYPGTCRSGLPPGRVPRAVRFRCGAGVIGFQDAVFGAVEEEPAVAVGDFVVKRADGPFAYQLAVVVDDAAQGVTQVVRGADLLSSTARQIALQRALGLPTPLYAHLPLILGADGRKLGKREGALPITALHEDRARATLRVALTLLGQDAADGPVSEIVSGAVERFDPTRIPKGPLQVDTLPG